MASSAPDAPERRRDAYDGQLYTMEEFMEEYGGLDQWHAAAPENPPEKSRRKKKPHTHKDKADPGRHHEDTSTVVALPSIFGASLEREEGHAIGHRRPELKDFKWKFPRLWEQQFGHGMPGPHWARDTGEWDKHVQSGGVPEKGQGRKSQAANAGKYTANNARAEILKLKEEHHNRKVRARQIVAVSPKARKNHFNTDTNMDKLGGGYQTSLGFKLKEHNKHNARRRPCVQTMKSAQVTNKDLADNCVLTLTLVSAKGLPAVDDKGMFRRKSSDPYVKLAIFSTHDGSGHGKQPQQSTVKENTIKPTWNEDFHFSFYSANDMHKSKIELEVYDYNDNTADMHMCGTRISLKRKHLQEAVKGSTIEKTVELVDYLSDSPAGFITYTLQVDITTGVDRMAELASDMRYRKKGGSTKRRKKRPITRGQFVDDTHRNRQPNKNQLAASKDPPIVKKARLLAARATARGRRGYKPIKNSLKTEFGEALFKQYKRKIIAAMTDEGVKITIIMKEKKAKPLYKIPRGPHIKTGYVGPAAYTPYGTEEEMGSSDAVRRAAHASHTRAQSRRVKMPRAPGGGQGSAAEGATGDMYM